MTPLTLEGRDLIDDLLDEQASFSAVETFAQRHDAGDLPEQARYYKELLPASAPGPGQQYAFRVDLDACSGCKACVAGCHSMNGLDDGETWRDVGQLVGVSGDHERPLDGLIQDIAGAQTEIPGVQHITTACHHCVDPGCLSGCPVKAYDKDPVTGVVVHLDDQCIGCQYCIFKCPYDVPKYSPERGIVRKCDMCTGRLAEGEAPACVAACPTQAISIQLVEVQDIEKRGGDGVSMPGAPDPTYTLPTTQYVGERAQALTTTTESADAKTPQPEHAHTPLIAMLTLTQAAVGVLIAAVALDVLAALGLALGFGGAPRLAVVGAATAAGLAGLISSTLHLGRPQYAFRALLGLRTSWLSREIAGFGGWFNTVLLYAGLLVLAPDLWGGAPRLLLGGGVVLTGLAAVFCSGMIYYDTPRPLWARWQTLASCYLTAAVLGGTGALVLSAWPDALPRAVAVLLAITAAAATWLQFKSARSVGQDPALRGSHQLLSGPLGPLVDLRNKLGVAGAFVLAPLAALLVLIGAPAALAGVVALTGFAATAAGEAIARTLFFTAVVAPKMPGQPQAAAA